MQRFVSNAIAVSKVLLARLRFLAVFLMAGLIVGYWEDIKNHADKWTRPAIPPDSLVHTSNIEYYCAMHPNVVRNEPGSCPICSMPLIKRKKGEYQELPADVLSRVQLSPQRVAMAGVDTAVVGYRELARTVQAIGVVDYDQTRLAQLAARVPGRIDRLLLQYVGQPVKKGQVVYSLYSPEVYTAIRDYLQARKRINDLAAKGSDELKMDAGDVYNASMQRLILWGVSREQLDTIDAEFDKTGATASHLDIVSPIDGVLVEKNVLEGAYLEVGSTPFTIADLSNLWFELKLFEDDAALVSVGQTAHITLESLPQEAFEGTITYMDFKLDPQTRTLSARAEVKNPEMKLRPGMFASARFEIPLTTASLMSREAATQPATMPSATAAPVFGKALTSYMVAQKRLAADSAENVSAALHEAAASLQPLMDEQEFKPAVDRFTAAVHATAGKDLAGLRESFKEVSAAMIELGKLAKLPIDVPAVSVYRCPMVKANWLQPLGETANPYYGTQMLTCGGPVQALPRAQVVQAPPGTAPAAKLLAVPRSAVIDTGKRKIVYVQSGEGVFDMKEIRTGPLADEWYPVVSGLQESDRVVMRGAFLVDAENRLNPTASVEPEAKGTAEEVKKPGGHSH